MGLFFINTSVKLKNTLFLSIFVLSQAACACVPVHHSTPSIPTTSFIQVFKKLEIKECKPKTSCVAGEFYSVGSGAVVGHSRSYSAVLTAGHVCELTLAPEAVEMIISRDVSMSVRNWRNERLEAEIIMIHPNPKLDLCMLRIPKMNVPAVKMARRKPKIGEKLFAMSAPAGIYHAPSVPILEGRFSGPLEDGVNSLTTIPAIGGSSGSAIMNSRMRIVGVLFASVRKFPFITLSTSHKETEIFVREGLRLLEPE